MNTIAWIPLVLFIILTEGAGGLGSLFTANKIPTWYAGLTKPSFNPPSWVFGPVWTVLYFLMGISGYLLWQNRQAPGAKLALTLFFVQLVLNAMWTPLFFGAQQLGWAFVEIVVMWVAIFATILASYPVNKWSALLLLPYLAWVTFASVLNFYLWKINR